MELKTLFEYQGAITQSVVDSVLSIAKIKLESVEAKQQAKKKVYNLLVECVENILKYAASHENLERNEPFIKLVESDEAIQIISGNLIDILSITAITNKIEKVNSLTKELLQDYYSEIMDNPVVSDKGGAGLGIIDMVMKSGNKIQYSFRPVNSESSFFELILTVNINI